MTYHAKVTICQKNLGLVNLWWKRWQISCRYISKRLLSTFRRVPKFREKEHCKPLQYQQNRLNGLQIKDLYSNSSQKNICHDRKFSMRVKCKAKSNFFFYYFYRLLLYNYPSITNNLHHLRSRSQNIH